MKQLALRNEVVAHRNVDGWDCGVLRDGTAFLSETGLAAVCGAARQTIRRHVANWGEGAREGRLAQLLVAKGINRESLYLQSILNGSPTNCYPADVCAVFVEYYAYEAEPRSETAVRNARKLLSGSINLIIYNLVGYSPAAQSSDPLLPAWKTFRERAALNPVPRGYFSVFREMGDMMLTMIVGGLPLDEHTVPDGSVGKHWATHWRDRELGAVYGDPKDHPHAYPENFKQSEANAFITAKVYPLAALGVFRVWMDGTYLPEKFPAYLGTKVTKRSLDRHTASSVLAAFGMDAAALPEAPDAAQLPPKRRARPKRSR